MDVVLLVIKAALALALLLVWAFTRLRLAAIGREIVRSVELEDERQAPTVVPPPSEVETDAAQSVQPRGLHDILHR